MSPIRLFWSVFMLLIIILLIFYLHFNNAQSESSISGLKRPTEPGKNKILKKVVSGNHFTNDFTSCDKNCLQKAHCMKCNFPNNCVYGSRVGLNCSTKTTCLNQSMSVEAVCQYCWQAVDEHVCTQVRNCSTNDIKLVKTYCYVADHVFCKGRRRFYKNVRCHWTNGYSWFKAMVLSLTLGGFGVDRFYLGLWKSAIGKLFSFGGLGLWTIIDIVLIAVGYLTPADGSLYI